MTTTSKIVLGVVVIVILAGLGWWYFRVYQPAHPLAPAYNDGYQSNSNVPPEDAAATTPSQNGGTVAPSGNTAAGNSDAALASSAASIDAQMSALSSDSTSADQSMNDQAISQN